MAKQTGLYHIRGKVGDYKYYGMKGVDGTIMAKQNEGMSERVKTDAAYDNTRRNNYEFGMATSTAGAIAKAFSQKWRYLLVPFATAKIAKELFAFRTGVGSIPWGDRVVPNNQIPFIAPFIMQKLVKNPISDFSAIALTVSEVEGVTTLTVTGDNLANDKAKAAGCDGVRAILVQSDIVTAQGGYTDKTIIGGSCVNKELAQADVAFGGDLSLTAENIVMEEGSTFSVVLLPYRTIGSEKYIMQEFCSALFARPEEA